MAGTDAASAVSPVGRGACEPQDSSPACQPYPDGQGHMGWPVLEAPVG